MTQICNARRTPLMSPCIISLIFWLQYVLYTYCDKYCLKKYQGCRCDILNILLYIKSVVDIEVLYPMKDDTV